MAGKNPKSDFATLEWATQIMLVDSGTTSSLEQMALLDVRAAGEKLLQDVSKPGFRNAIPDVRNPLTSKNQVLKLPVGQHSIQPLRGFRLNQRTMVVTAIICILTIHVGLLAHAATQHSPTMMEPAFLVAGLSNWEFGRFELFRVNPPLVRMLAALPVMAAGYEMNWWEFCETPDVRPVFPLGETFVRANGERSLQLMMLARWACIPVSLLGAGFCFFWSRELWGNAVAGMISFSLWCFEPNILAHAELVTADCAAAALGVGAGYFYWRWLKKPTWSRSFGAGLLLGLALLSKLTWIILLVLWPVLWLLCRRSIVSPSTSREMTEPRPVRAHLAQLAALLLTGVYILNLGYFFDGTFTPLKDFNFVSAAFSGSNERGVFGNRFAESAVRNLPVPFPKQFVLGIDVQQNDFEKLRMPSYLRGEWKPGGWWYYYLYGLLVKVPHGVQLLVLISVVAVVLNRNKGAFMTADLWVLLLPAFAVLLVVSSRLQFNHHFRYVLPSFGFVFVLAGGVWSLKKTTIRFIVVSAVLTTALEAIANHPHALAYFNYVAGGPSEGHKHMLHSNLDWEQDVLIAKQWMREQKISPEELRVSSYYPFFMEQFLLSRAAGTPEPRWNVVSSNKVFEPDSPWADRIHESSTQRIGYSIWAFPAER